MRTRFAFLLGVFLVFAVPLRADFDAGYDAFEQGDFDAALRHWLPLAEAGDATAQYNLGVMHEHGLGFARDFDRAVAWYVAAAENGKAEAQRRVGELLADGYWGDYDFAEAANWYRLAAEQGHTVASRELGILYARGRGVPRDRNEAVRWLGEASIDGDAEAEAWLRRLMADDPTVKKSVANRSVELDGPRCEGDFPADYSVDVSIEIPTLPINHELSLAELNNRVFEERDYTRAGMTSYGLERKIDPEYFFVPRGGAYCLWLGGFDVELRYTTLQIYIAKEYRSGSCRYQELLQHERDHVLVAEQVLKYYVPRVKATLRSRLIPTGRAPLLVDSPDEATRALEDLFATLLEPLLTEMGDTLEQRQSELDTREEYDRLYDRCVNQFD
ncbi:MAG: tetratricopeptide repeat protein [Alphaproteobacteria bacterium]